MSLNRSERLIYERLFEPDFTLAEGLQLYNSVVANGRQFPVDWEIRILELGLAAHPDRKDMSDRLEQLRGEVRDRSRVLEDQRLVTEAKERFAHSCGLSTEALPPHGVRWAAYAKRIRDAISEITSPVEALHFAQSKIGFEHRGHVQHEGKFTAMYERELAASFPQFADRLNQFADIAGSAAETTYEHNGRPISNVLFYLARVILSCLAVLPEPPRVILEVGGGYGAPGRLWMMNSISRPKCYLILDMPESLFFADVFLRKEFGENSVCYVTGREHLTDEAVERFSFILCPLPLFNALGSLPVDLVVNTGSLQEMSEEWVDFYRAWLDRQRCRWFYSLNYFAQPVSALWESGNLLSPRLGPDWIARLLRWNPAFVRMQSDRDFLEALYEKGSAPLGSEEAEFLLNRQLERAPSGEVMVEMFDLIRRSSDPKLMLRVLSHAMSMPVATKEALWLAKELLGHPLGKGELEKVARWREELESKRALGVEAFYQ
ncbi:MULTISPECIES: putative sugar O-methyltransferase [unclassified Bradyrhizobium]